MPLVSMQLTVNTQGKRQWVCGHKDYNQNNQADSRFHSLQDDSILMGVVAVVVESVVEAMLVVVVVVAVQVLVVEKDTQ